MNQRDDMAEDQSNLPWIVGGAVTLAAIAGVILWRRGISAAKDRALAARTESGSSPALRQDVHIDSDSPRMINDPVAIEPPRSSVARSPAPTPTRAPLRPLPTIRRQGVLTAASPHDGPAIRIMQQQLKDLGYTIMHVDGVYGPETTLAVESFRTDSGLAPDSGALAVLIAVDMRYAHVFDPRHG